MIDKPSHHGLAGSRKFIPQVKALESRLLLSAFERLTFPDGTSVVVPVLNQLPRTGGAFAQSGSVLNIGVGQPTTNNVHVAVGGGGNETVEWNGRQAHVLTGVDSTVIQMRRALRDQVTINLASRRTAPAPLAVGSLVASDAASPRGDGAVAAMGIRRTGGTAFQSGSVLTVSVTRFFTNSVQISNEGGGDVLVEWNGGAVHSFSGVDTIVVDTHNARTDVVAIHDVTG